VLSALLPAGSTTQHTTTTSTGGAAAAAKPATAQRGVVSGNDIPMITELGQPALVGLNYRNSSSSS